jgi:hypothetical protein
LSWRTKNRNIEDRDAWRLLWAMHKECFCRYVWEAADRARSTAQVGKLSRGLSTIRLDEIRHWGYLCSKILDLGWRWPKDRNEGS